MSLDLSFLYKNLAIERSLATIDKCQDRFEYKTHNGLCCKLKYAKPLAPRKKFSRIFLEAF
jgi:hypothetical protein